MTNVSDNKTLIFISTHIINKAVVSEYKKLQNIDGYDCLLCIDNTSLHIEAEQRITDLVYYDTKVKCFLFDKKLHDSLNLPNYCENYITNDFKKIMWQNADYRFYYVKEYFPQYDYYWQIDYDVFMNGTSYKEFLDKNNTDEDLLIAHFRPETINDDWCWTHEIDYIYKDTPLYGSFFPVCRLSNKSINFLMNKRTEYCKIYDSIKNKKGTRWLNCELFVPTELVNNNFTVRALEEMENVHFDNEYDLNEDRIFEKPDNKLYHPVRGNFVQRLSRNPLEDYYIYINLFGIKIKKRKEIKSSNKFEQIKEKFE